MEIIDKIEKLSVDDWLLEPGWQIDCEGERYRLNGTGHTWARLRWGEHWDDFSCQLRLRLDRGGVHLNYRISEEGRYFFGIREDEIYLIKELPWGEFENLARSDLHIDLDSWHEIFIVGKKGDLQIYVDNRLVLERKDNHPLTHGSIAFETLEQSHAIIEDIRVFTRISVQPGYPLHITLDEGAWRNWNLKTRAAIVPYGNRQMLTVGRDGCAVFPVLSLQYCALRFRYLAGFAQSCGSGTISLQSAATGDMAHKIQLRIRDNRLSLVQITNGETSELSVADVHFEPQRWYDVTLHMLYHWILVTVDGIETLRAHDVPSFPLENLGFSNELDGDVAYADIVLTPWTASLAHERRQILERLLAEPTLLPPKPPVQEIPDKVVPLELAVYNSKREFHPLNPGQLPPFFVHTWALDVKGVDTFRFYFKSKKDIQLDKGDKIVVYDMEGLAKTPAKPLAIIPATATKEKTLIDISKTKYDQTKDGKKYRRIYITLETSSIYCTRCFYLTGLVVVGQGTGSAEVLVVGDDIKYFGTGPLTETVDSKGYTIPLPPPWNPLFTCPASFDRPQKDEGWYHLGQYLADNKQGFYVLAYYNEHKSRFRLYLYNYDLPNASFYSVRLSLKGRSPTKQSSAVVGPGFTWYKELEGAFFPLDINPDKWSTITIPIKNWSPACWIMVEVPFLYPMAKTLPGAKVAKLTGAGKTRYRSLYEEALKDGMRNMLLMVEVKSYLKGALNGDWVGRGIGNAVETINKSGTNAWDLVAAGWSAIESAKSWMDSGEKFDSALKDFYKKNKKNASESDVSWKVIEGITTVGPSAWLGAIGMAGAIFTTLTKFVLGKDPEPLALSLYLSMRGTLTADISIEKQPRRCAFFLPGRFSISEALSSSGGLPINEPRTIDSALPRYDRTLGHIGYYSNPSDVTLRVVRWDHITPITDPGEEIFPDIYVDFVYPAAKKPDAKWLFKDASKTGYKWDKYRFLTLDEGLPVIFNPFVEIAIERPLPSSANGTWSDLKGKFPYSMIPSKWWYEKSWLYDVSPKEYINPEPDDADFPKTATLIEASAARIFIKVVPATDYAQINSIWGTFVDIPGGALLQVLPAESHIPSTFEKYKQLKNLKLHEWYHADMVKMENSIYHSPSKSNPYPLHSAIYYWDVPYTYYGRSRKYQKQGKWVVPRSHTTVRLISPMTFHVTGYSVHLHPDYKPSKSEGDVYLVKSRLLST
jgi:hypothetical protein